MKCHWCGREDRDDDWGMAFAVGWRKIMLVDKEEGRIKELFACSYRCEASVQAAIPSGAVEIANTAGVGIVQALMPGQWPKPDDEIMEKIIKQILTAALEMGAFDCVPV